MAFGVIYNPSSTPIANRITRWEASVDTHTWLSQPNALANPEIDDGVDLASAKWNGTKIVALTPEELFEESEVSRKSSWESQTISYYNRITSAQRTVTRL